MNNPREEKRNLETIPVGSLRMIPLEGCKNLGKMIDSYLVRWRTERENEHKDSLAFAGYQRDSYILDAKIARFGSGEAKGIINESVRGTDLYLIVDVNNYSLTYSLCGIQNHMSPDDHYQDLKRIIAAVGGKARRITVIMPFLYESRQHKRSARESLDCALALQELVRMGVDNIITFDAHDARVQNAIPLNGFEFTFILIAYIIWFNVMSNRIRRKTWNMTWREREAFKEKLEEEYKANPPKTFKEIIQTIFKKLLGEEKKVED